MTMTEWLECDDLDKLMDFLCEKRRSEITPGEADPQSARSKLDIGLALFAPARIYPRKRRLFACACCERVRHLMRDEGRLALEFGERLADHLVSEDEALAVGQVAVRAGRGLTRSAHLTMAAGWTCMTFGDHSFVLSVSDFDAGFTATARYVLHAVASTDDNDAAIADFFENFRLVRAGEAPLPCQNEHAVKAEQAAQVSLFRCIFGNPFWHVSINPKWLTWNDGIVVQLARTIYEEKAFDQLPVLADALEDAGCGNQRLLDHCRHPGPHARGCWPVDLLLGKE